MNLVFKALSDPTRRRVLEILRQGPRTAGELAAEFDVSRSVPRLTGGAYRDASGADPG